MLTHPLLSIFYAAAGSIAVAAGSRIFLPEPTGPHKIGLTHLELIDESRVDRFAPKPVFRDLMVTLFYPIADPSSMTVTVGAEPAPAFAPQFPGPATASYIDALLRLPNGTASRLTTRAYLDAPRLTINTNSGPGTNGKAKPPPAATTTYRIILFSHGFGFTRSLYTALLSDLASHGWTAISVDHPHDAGIVEYPNGRVARPHPGWGWPLDPALRESLLEARVADLLFVLGQLRNASTSTSTSTSNRNTAAAKLSALFGEGSSTHHHHGGLTAGTSRVAAIGHSFGGATAVQALLDSADVVAAADLDGFLYGPVVRRGTPKPVLVLGFPEHFATDDPDAAAPGWPSLRGWKADFTVEGAVHESFSDYPVLADVLGLAGGGGDGGPLGDAGRVGGERMVRIMGAYVGAFLERFVLGSGGDDGDGDGSLLEGNSTGFPEVKLRRKGDDQLQTQSMDQKLEL
ncbi:hypothetical protein SLS62_005009 [Diatrype stigma]|uniref:1-alkyl-2-acetylglycerophosphocholine esterase n=1 Tax=Diatrype stigma TaxID=117547 RepID=A0AAN9V211_9PEZI